MIKVLSLFSGIGAFEKALNRANIDYELVNYCEIDKHASKSYSEIHNISEDLNLWDVTTIDTSRLPKGVNLITHGSPCQSYSIAGKQEGGDKGSGTQSSLMWETVRIIKDIKPKIVIWENVKNVLSKKHKHNFDAYIELLNNLSYNSYYQVLNAKDYGIPQNRERIFVVSIREDIDDGNFEFPNGFPLKSRLKDIMDDVVDEKYYLNQKDTDKFKTLITSGKNGCQQVGFLDRPTTHEFSNRIYSTDGIARTLMGSGGNQNDKAGQYLIEPSIRRIDILQTVNEYSPSLRASRSGLKTIDTELRIRRLTPKEAFRLMGFNDADFEKAAKVTSQTQLYKQAGNSIVVNVLEEIFKELRVYLEK